jgi:hypothetical protein
MKLYNITILIFSLLSIVTLSSCSGDSEEIITEALESIPKDIPEGDIINPSETTEVYARKTFLKKFRVSEDIYLRPLGERLESLATDKLFFFDILSGKCFNVEGKVERGESNSLECSSSDVLDGRADEFSNYSFFGADARGINVSEAKVSLFDLIFAEVKFDKNSILNTDKKPFYKLFHNQKRVYFGQQNALRKYSKALIKYKENIRSLKIKFKKAKNDKSRNKLKNKINKTKNKILLTKLNYKIAKKKSRRHLKELKWISKVEEISNIRDTFSLKNKESTFFDGATAYTFKPSNEIITTQDFSISLWFKTSINQHDKRLFNLHRGESAGSAINLSLKYGKIVMGTHNGTKYISNEIDFEYDDEIWHHYLITKKKNKFSLFIDGVKSLDYVGDFSKLGTFPAMIGSYNGKGYFYTGDIDEVSIWKTALSKKEIRMIFNSGVATNLNTLSSSISLTHWWRMGDHKKDSQTKRYDFISKSEAFIVD